MRTLLDIPDDDLNALTALAKRQGRSRSALMREAIDRYLVSQRAPAAGESFGAWTRLGDKRLLPRDGLAFERTLRSEWER